MVELICYILKNSKLVSDVYTYTETETAQMNYNTLFFLPKALFLIYEESQFNDRIFSLYKVSHQNQCDTVTSYSVLKKKKTY